MLHFIFVFWKVKLPKTLKKNSSVIFIFVSIISDDLLGVDDINVIVMDHWLWLSIFVLQTLNEA